MCGIVGYVGNGDAVPVLVEGLQRLEYRGYDSAGVAVVGPSGLKVHKRAGRVDDLVALPKRLKPVGIGHTRWATHGEPTDANAHPHVDASGHVAVIHNGIVENAAELRAKLLADGVELASDTDTEVIAQLVGLRPATCCSRTPCARRCRWWWAPTAWPLSTTGSPAASSWPATAARWCWAWAGAHFVASDVTALVRHTDQVVHLDDHEVCCWRLVPHLHPRRPTHRQAAGHHRGGRHGVRPGRPALPAQGDPRAAGVGRPDAERAARAALRHRPPGRPRADGRRAGHPAGQDPGLRVGVLRRDSRGAADRGPEPHPGRRRVPLP